MKQHSLLKKVLVLSMAVILCSLYIAYEAGAFKKPFRQLLYAGDKFTHTFYIRSGALTLAEEKKYNPEYAEEPQLTEFDYMLSSKVVISTSDIDYYSMLSSPTGLSGGTAPFGMAVQPGVLEWEKEKKKNREDR